MRRAARFGRESRGGHRDRARRRRAAPSRSSHRHGRSGRTSGRAAIRGHAFAACEKRAAATADPARQCHSSTRSRVPRRRTIADSRGRRPGGDVGSHGRRGRAPRARAHDRRSRPSHRLETAERLIREEIEKIKDPAECGVLAAHVVCSREARARRSRSTSGRPSGRPTALSVRSDAPRAIACIRLTRRRRPSADRCTSVTCFRTRTPTSSRASSACAGSRCSIRWDGTTTDCRPNDACRTTSASAAIRRLPYDPAFVPPGDARQAADCRSPGRTSSSSASTLTERGRDRRSRTSGGTWDCRSTGR